MTPKPLIEVITKVGLEKFAKGTVVRYRDGVAEAWCSGAQAAVYPYAFFTSRQPDDVFMFFPVMELALALQPLRLEDEPGDPYMDRLHKYAFGINATYFLGRAKFLGV